MKKLFLVIGLIFYLVSPGSTSGPTSTGMAYDQTLTTQGTTNLAGQTAANAALDIRLKNSIWPNDPSIAAALGTATEYITALESALVTIGSTQCTLHIPRGTYTVPAGGVTLPSNVNIKMESGGMFVLGAGNLTINGTLDAGHFQIFSCTGTGKALPGAVKEISPEWWGTNTTPGVTDMYAALQAAFTAANTAKCRVVLQPQIYGTSDELFIQRMLFSITGQDSFNDQLPRSQIKYIGSADATKSVFRVTGGYGNSIDEVEFNANKLAGYGLRLEANLAIGENFMFGSSKNLSTCLATVGGLYLGDTVSGTVNSMVDQLSFYNYVGYNNAKNLIVNTQNASSINFFGGTMQSGDICLYHAYIKATKVAFYGTSFTILTAAGAQWGIYITSGSVDVFGGYNETGQFLKIVDMVNNSCLYGLIIGGTPTGDYCIDVASTNVMSLILHGIQAATGSIRATGNAQIVADGTSTKGIIRDSTGATNLNLVENARLDRWNGTASLDGWGIVGATLAQESTIVKEGTYSAKLTGQANQYSQLYQDIIPFTNYYRGKIMTLGAWVYAPSTNTGSQRLLIGTYRSVDIPKDDVWHFVTVTATLGSAITENRIVFYANENTAVDGDVLYVGPVVVREGVYIESFEPKPTGISDLFGLVTWDPGSIANGAGLTSADITVTGAALTDYVIPSASIDLQGVTCTAYVKATNTVKIQLTNNTGGAVDLVNSTWRVRVLK